MKAKKEAPAEASTPTSCNRMHKYTELFTTDKTGFFILLAAYLIQAIIIFLT